MKKKLGKKPVKLDKRTLKFAKYKTLAPTPSEVSWVMKVGGWPMMLNDVVGDCVPAAAGHAVQQWSFYANPPGYVPSDSQILRDYEHLSGYNPNDPASDVGCTMLDALKYWRKYGIANHKISAYVAVNPQNRTEMMQAIYLFGNVFLGFSLPWSVAQADRWTVPDGGIYGQDGEPGSWGGHCVTGMAGSPRTLSFISWGMRMKASWNFVNDYCDEAYAILSPDWIEQNGLSPSSFNLIQLQQDLSQL